MLGSSLGSRHDDFNANLFSETVVSDPLQLFLLGKSEVNLLNWKADKAAVDALDNEEVVKVNAGDEAKDQQRNCHSWKL